MRILHCLRAPVGGLFRHVLDLAEEQSKRGHDVGILADSNAEDRLTSSKFAAIEPKLTLGIARIPMRRQPGLGDLAAVRDVRRHAAKLDLDVLHGHGAKGGAYARLAAVSIRGRSIKTFYTPHGGSLNLKPGPEQRVHPASRPPRQPRQTEPCPSCARRRPPRTGRPGVRRRRGSPAVAGVRSGRGRPSSPGSHRHRGARRPSRRRSSAQPPSRRARPG